MLSQMSEDPNGTLMTGLQNRERPFTQVINLRLNRILKHIVRLVRSKNWPTSHLTARIGAARSFRSKETGQAHGLFY